MWRSKKFIIITILAIVVLLSTFGTGTVLAAEEDSDDPKLTFIERVAGFLEITPEQLREAFQDTRDYMQTLDPEERSPDVFKDKMNEYLGDVGAIMGIEEALALAREEIKTELGAKLEGIREQIRNRWTEMQERGEEWREQFHYRLEGLRERLRSRWSDFQEMFQNRLQQWREKRSGWWGSFGTATQGDSGSGNGNGNGSH